MDTQKRFYSANWLTACLLSTAGAAHAIGLGEINIHSALGQPLQASIALLGEKNLSADCIKLQASGDYGLPMPPTLKFELKETVGKPPKLWLSTSQAMHEPALGFAVILQCDGRLQREYAILLDPAPTPHEEVAPSLPMIAATTEPVTTGHTAAEPTRRVAAKRNRAAAVRDSNTTPIRNPPKPSGRATPHQPRLTLSGSRLFRVDPELGLPLKLDFTLPDPERIPDKPLSETERLDDNIALTHKLAHLEQQLVSLQKRNEELTRRAAPTQTLEKTAAQATESPFRSLPQWVYILAGMLLLSGAIAWVLSRRQANRRYEKEDDNVILPPPQREDRVTADNTPRSTTHVPPPPVPESQANDLQLEEPELNNLQFEESKLHDELEDVVEVYLAHDNPDMAIQLLEQDIQQNPETSPAPWLTLLDFLQRAGDTARHDRVRGEFRQLFNINIPDTDHIQLTQGKTGIESYPHILSELLHLWPTENAVTYLDALLRDTRGGTRAGFDIDTYRDITLLTSILQSKSRE